MPTHITITKYGILWRGYAQNLTVITPQDEAFTTQATLTLELLTPITEFDVVICEMIATNARQNTTLAFVQPVKCSEVRLGCPQCY